MKQNQLFYCPLQVAEMFGRNRNCQAMALQMTYRKRRHSTVQKDYFFPTNSQKMFQKISFFAAVLL